MTGKLYLVSTPIGNLGDLSHRAVDVLKSVDAILAEDTRHTRTLLDHYDVRTPMVAYHEHNEARTVPRVLERLAGGEDLALVSDAGTPLLSDPGERLVAAAVERGIDVIPVPGASALLAALTGTGFGTEVFTFHGFIPRRGRERDAALAEIVGTAHTVILYESPLRTADTLADLARAGAGARPAVVARELTKKFEEFRRGTVAELAEYYTSTPARGEIVLVLGPTEPTEIAPMDLAAAASEMREQGVQPREIVRRLMDDYGAKRNAAYKLAHADE